MAAVVLAGLVLLVLMLALVLVPSLVLWLVVWQGPVLALAHVRALVRASWLAMVMVMVF